MFNEPKLGRIAHRSITASLLLLVCLLAGCCATSANIGVVRGTSISPRELPGTWVVVCPNEEVTLGWITEKATSASITDIGSVPMPTGSRTIVATETKDYKLSVGGDCDRSATAHVIVVKSGTRFMFSAGKVGELNKGTLHWEAFLSEQFYSPQVKVTSVRLNAPPTVSGWSVRKIDLDGTVRQFQVNGAFSTPTSQPFPLPGTWSLLPVNLNELTADALPLLVELEVTLDCGN